MNTRRRSMAANSGALSSTDSPINQQQTTIIKEDIGMELEQNSDSTNNQSQEQQVFLISVF